MKQKKVYHLFILIIVFSLIIFAGVAGYFRFIHKQQVLFMPSVQQSGFSKEFLKNEIANWRVYKNEKYGFEIKYPSGWIECSTVDDDLNNGLRVTIVTLSESDKKCRFGANDFDTPPEILQITEEISVFQEFNTLDVLKIALKRMSLSGDKLFIIKGRGGLFEIGKFKDVLFNNVPALEVYEGSPAGYGGNNAIYIFRNSKLLRIFSSISFEAETEEKTILSTFKFTN